MSNSFKRDINQLGMGDSLHMPATPLKPYLDAIVEDVVINEEGGSTLKYDSDGSNLGQIRFREVPDDRRLPISKLRTAFPLESNFLEYPLVGEQVMVYKTMGSLYYSRRVNVSRKPTDSVWTEMRNALASDNSVVTNQDTVQLIKGGVTVNLAPDTLPTPTKPTLTAKTKFLRPSPGDLIIQGRLGNTIRFGSNLFESKLNATSPSPNIIITAGQWDNPDEVSTTAPTPFSMYYENINKDKSSIWMVSNQTVKFLPATAISNSDKKAHLLSSNVKTSNYSGAQIFINSDRVILNSKKNELSLFSNLEINLSALKSITLDTETDIALYGNGDISLTAGGTISLSATSILMDSKEDLAYKTSGNYSIIGKKIFIGRYGDTNQPMVLGSTLALWLNALITLLTRPGAVITPTGPATFDGATLTAINALKAQLGGTRNPQSAVFNSRDNFTAETNTI